MPFGARFVCSVCWKSGRDHIKRYRDVQPLPPEPVPTQMPVETETLAPETRKARRSKLLNRSSEKENP